MSISPLGSAIGLLSANPSAVQQRRQDFQQLSNALKAGDLTGAQDAFAALTKSLSKNSSSSTNGSSVAQQLNDPNSPLGQDIAALGQALQSGDLSGAQQDFARLQQDLKPQLGAQGPLRGAHHHHGHHPPPAAGSGDDDTGSASGSTDSTDPFTNQIGGSTIDVTA